MQDAGSKIPDSGSRMQGADAERVTPGSRTPDSASRLLSVLWRVVVLLGFLIFIAIDVVVVVVGLNVLSGSRGGWLPAQATPTARPTRPLILPPIAMPTVGLRSPVPAAAAATFTATAAATPTATPTILPTRTATAQPGATATPTGVPAATPVRWQPRHWRFLPLVITM